MRIQASRRGLVDALSLAMGVVPARTTKAILQNVRIRSIPAGLEVVATDLEVSLRLLVDEVEVMESGELVVSAARLHAVLRELGQDGVDLVVEGHTAHMSAGTDRVELLGSVGEEFPEVDAFGEGPELRVPGRDLRVLFRRTEYAAAREATRYALNGVLLDVADGRLRMVATDGKRLALAETPHERATGESVQALLPVRGVQQAGRLLTEVDEDVRLGVGKNQFKLKTRRAELCCQLVEGQFPRYADVLPRGDGTPVRLSRETFAALVRRAASLNTPEVQSVRLKLGQGRLVIASEVRDVGSTHAEMVVEYDGSPVELAFNPQFLLEFLKTVDEPVVDAYLTRSDAPGLFLGGPGYRYVIMPMSLA
ncbi:MAG: DNA polymerase III subunit beta [Planctomycetes bacterium]|nr:DNA polymerase III subunit beta [Planctomycetota bacterium]